MKGLKKIALASAVAAAPFAAQAELKAMDDASMSSVTGQAGVTIELSTHIGIGEFTYTDEGSFSVSDIEIGGGSIDTADGTVADGSNLDDLALTIDVEADGDAFISVHSISGAPIDFGVSVGSASLNDTAGSNSTTLISDLTLTGNLAQLDIRVDNDGGDSASSVAGTLNIDTMFQVTDLDMDVDFMAMGIRNMTIGQDSNDLLGDGLGFAAVSLEVYETDQAVGYAGAATGAPETALAVDIEDTSMDIEIGSVIIGETAGEPDSAYNVGSVAIEDLAITNTSMIIYGH